MDQAADPTPVTVEYFGATDVGVQRFSNEDTFAIGDLAAGEALRPEETLTADAGDAGPLFVVCDGMGGAAAGEVASAMAVDVVIAEMSEVPQTDERAAAARYLRRAVRAANRRVFEEGAANWKLKGMGTTLSAALVVGKELLLAQVGDSRAYIRRGETLVQVTRDQSVVSALLHAGRITEEEAENFAQANVILQALGVQQDVEVALSLVELRRGDRMLLCSDGLHGCVDDAALAEVLGMQPGIKDAVEELISLARDAGGPDNITAVVVEFGGLALPEPTSEDDLPRFVEFDPMEEGERAMTTTSRVAKRLAARAGVGDDPGPRKIPATGMHVVVNGEENEPANAVLADRSRVGTMAWIMAAVALLAIGALLLLGR